MKLACRTVPYTKYSFERALEGIEAAGVRYVAFGNPNHNGKKVPDEDDPQSVKKIRRLLDKYHLEPVMITGTYEFAIDLPLERAIRRLDTAQELGVREVMSNGMKLSEGREEEQRRQFVEKYKRIAELAAERDITLTIKPHGSLTATHQMIGRLIEDIGFPNIQMTFDPANLRYYADRDPLEGFAEMADITRSVVAKDHRGKKGESIYPIPGKGEVDFPALFGILHKAGFSGIVMTELLNDPDYPTGTPEEIDVLVKHAVESVRRLLQEGGFQPG
jgi:sugar phosphate isomerase/epimerase